MTKLINLQLTQVDMNIYALDTPIAKYMVSYTDFPRSSSEADIIELAFDNGRDRELATIKGYLVSEKKISMGNIPGRELLIEVSAHQIRQRLYLVRTYAVEIELY